MVAPNLKMWHVSLFGGLNVLRQGSSDMRVRSKKAGGILGYLSYFKGQAFSREVLADQYWPDCDPDTARQNLRAALAILRRQLEPPGFDGTMLMADREAVWINADAVSTDVSLFFELIEEADGAHTERRVELLSEAVALVKGPLLPGHEGVWILPQQLHLDEEAAQASVKAVAALSELDDWDGAIRTGKLALTKWPLREDIHMAVMRAQALAGRPTEAIKQFEELEKLLDENWGEAPSKEAENLLNNLPTASTTAPRSTPTPERVSVDRAVVQPPTRSVQTIPARITSFVNRVNELESLGNALTPGSDDYRRLVTIIGPGGCGKTRLALEVASRQTTKPGRVWYVPLADTEDASLVAAEVRKALGLDATPRADALSQVTGFLGDESAILVLDNFEQVAADGALAVAHMLELCPNLACLVTSRRALNIEGEQLLQIKPLPVPEPSASPAALEECESVRLFVDRARSARQDFRLSRTNSEAVAELCRRLDGLPLALELAASRISTCTPAQILGRIGEATEFLTSRMRNTTDRHRSLRATVEWSVRLLSEEAKTVFRRVSVFRGGWSHEAAAYVCESKNTDEQLQSLTDCSLIQAEPTEDGMRFSMLEAVRQQALSLLSEAEEEVATRDRHLSYFSHLVEGLAPNLMGATQGEVADHIEQEMDNLREAASWASTKPVCPEDALRLVGGIRYFFGFRGHAELWHTTAKALLEGPYKGQPAPKIEAYLCAGGLGFYRSEFEDAYKAYEQAAVLAEKAKLDALHAEAVCGLGVGRRAMGDFPGAAERYGQGLEICKRTDAKSVEYRIHYNLGLMHEFQEQFEEAKEHYQLSVRLCEQAQDKRLLARNQDALGRCALHDKDPQGAIRFHREARRLFSEVGDRIGEIEVLGNLALMELTLGRYSTALDMFRDTLMPLWEVQNFWELRSNIVLIATCLLDQGEHEKSVRALATTELIDKKLTVEMSRGDREAYDQATKAVSQQLSTDAIEQIKDEVWSTSLGTVIRELAEPSRQQARSSSPQQAPP